MMRRLLGHGGNGVVVKEECCGAPIALKFWIPHVLRGTVYGEAAHLGAFKDDLERDPCFRVRIKGMGVRIKYFGYAFPRAHVEAFAKKRSVQLSVSSITQTTERPSCINYTIEGTVQPKEIGNGIVRMHLAGSTLYETMPLKPPDVCKLIVLLCSAAQSALRQGYSIPDIKPENICMADDGWVLVDVDNLPLARSRSGAQESTYRVQGATDGIDAMIASMVITVAMAAGVVGKGDALFKYHFASCKATFLDLQQICHPALQVVLHPMGDLLCAFAAAKWEAQLLASGEDDSMSVEYSA